MLGLQETDGTILIRLLIADATKGSARLSENTVVKEICPHGAYCTVLGPVEIADAILNGFRG